MSYLVDTNVLLSSIQRTHAMHSDAVRVTALLTRQGEDLTIIAQNLIEFWGVGTRPVDSNGLGLSVPEALGHINTFKITFRLLPDTPEILGQWVRLVEHHKVLGRQVHDAILVAAMAVYKVSHLLTFNDADFKRFTERTVVNPASIV